MNVKFIQLYIVSAFHSPFLCIFIFFCLVCQPFSTGVQLMDAGFQVASS